MDDRVHIGTSGWSYDHWRGLFYPETTARDVWFDYYAKQFGTVEVNSTFYNVPSERTVATWRDRAPASFRYALKAHRYITHRKKLLEPHKTLPRFLEVAEQLGDKLGILLFQLPPRWHAVPDRLATFLQAVPDRYRCAVEFRDPSWYTDEVYQVLEDAGAAFCVHDHGEAVSPRVVTSDIAYVRFHGTLNGGYDREELRAWAGTISTWLRTVKEVYVYFNNDWKAHAPRDAQRLAEMVVQPRRSAS